MNPFQITNAVVADPQPVDVTTVSGALLALKGMDIEHHNDRVEDFQTAREVIRAELPEGYCLVVSHEATYYGEIDENPQTELELCEGDCEYNPCDDCPSDEATRGRGRPRIPVEKQEAIRALDALDMYTISQIAGMVDVGRTTAHSYMRG